MGERRTVDLGTPNVVELELDESLEDTRCVACLLEGKNRPARDCPHNETVRTEAMEEMKRQSVAAEVRKAPTWVLIDMLHRLLARRPWWASAGGRKRMRERIELDARKRDDVSLNLGEDNGSDD